MAEKDKSDCDCVSEWQYLNYVIEKGPDGKSLLEKFKRQQKSHELVANQVIFHFDFTAQKCSKMHIERYLVSKQANKVSWKERRSPPVLKNEVTNPKLSHSVEI